MKKYILMFLLTLPFVMTSCLDDDYYSVGKFWVDFGVIDKQGDNDFTVILDDGDVIYPIAGMVYGHHLSDGQRVMVDYTILDDKTRTDTLNEYFVKVNSIDKVLQKGIMDITPAIEDSIGNDPIVVKHAWVSHGNLLTLHLRYWGNNKVHYINLVKEPGTLTAADQPIELELRHNDRNDRQLYAMSAFVSFDLSAIKIQGLDSVRFRIKAVDYDDEAHYIEKTFKY